MFVPAKARAAPHAGCGQVYCTQNSLDPITIDPKLYFDIEKTGDLTVAKSRRASCERAAAPDLMIGNPPYGVKIVKGAHYDDVYDLNSRDSYGYFIVNAIKRLPEGNRLIYIVSSSFLTIGSHKSLRDVILSTARLCGSSSCIEQPFRHRHFPGHCGAGALWRRSATRGECIPVL